MVKDDIFQLVTQAYSEKRNSKCSQQESNLRHSDMFDSSTQQKLINIAIPHRSKEMMILCYYLALSGVDKLHLL